MEDRTLPQSVVERLVRLETAMGYERRTTDGQIAWLASRVQQLERRPPPLPARPPMSDHMSMLKLGIAVALPLSVLLATGSVEKAAHIARVVSGAP